MPTPSRAGATLAVGVMLLTGVAGCGGGDEEPDPQSRSTGPDQGSSPTGVQPKVRDCQVTVVLSGAVTQSLEGAGRAIYDNDTGPEAFYQFSSGDTSVQVYSEGKNFTASVVISTKRGSFTSEPGTEGLDVSTTGRSARVDSETVALDEDSDGVHVKATYTCA